MKKLFAKITSLIIVAIMSAFALSGCQLISINSERDMAQPIAHVYVDDDFRNNGSKEDTEILKYELASAYNSEGYYYVQYQGLSVQETYELLLENIVKNKILVQQSKIALSGANGYFSKAFAKAEADRTSTEKVLAKKNHADQDLKDVAKTASADLFLTKFEYLQCQYAVLSYARQIIEGYKDAEDDGHNHDAHETFQGTVRSTIAAPTEEDYDEYELEFDEEGKKIDKNSDFYKSFAQVNSEAELGLNLTAYTTKYELAYAVYDAYVKNFINFSEDRVALNKLVKDLKSLGFITNEEADKKTPSDATELLELTYFKSTLRTQCENEIISKFESALINEQEGYLASDEALFNAYVNLYNTQKSKYDSDFSVYETALENSTEESLIVYHPTASEGKYGYVLNLLIGFSDEQSAILTSIEENDILSLTQKNTARENLLKTLTAKDLRDSWVESNFGEYNSETGSFTFDAKYFKSEEESLRTYQGNIYGAKDYIYHDDYDEEKTGYSFSSVKGKEVSFTKFHEEIVCAIMGFDKSVIGINSDTKKYNVGKLSTCTETEINKFKDIIFAYSTDPGSLKDNNGYLYSPKTSKTNYVKEFADCAKQLVESGVGSYAIVATDFGYHILLCTKVIEPSVIEYDFSDMDTAFAKFKEDLKVEGTNAYKFKEYQKDALISDNVSKKTELLFNQTLEDATKVQYIKENYKDLIPE